MKYLAIAYIASGACVAVFDWLSMGKVGRSEHLARFGIFVTIIQYLASVPIWPGYLFTRRLANEPPRSTDFAMGRRKKRTGRDAPSKTFDLRDGRSLEFLAYISARQRGHNSLDSVGGNSRKNKRKA